MNLFIFIIYWTKFIDNNQIFDYCCDIKPGIKRKLQWKIVQEMAGTYKFEFVHSFDFGGQSKTSAFGEETPVFFKW